MSTYLDLHPLPLQPLIWLVVRCHPVLILVTGTDTDTDTDNFIAVSEVYKWNEFGESLDMQTDNKNLQ